MKVHCPECGQNALHHTNDFRKCSRSPGPLHAYDVEVCAGCDQHVDHGAGPLYDLTTDWATDTGETVETFCARCWHREHDAMNGGSSCRYCPARLKSERDRDWHEATCRKWG